MVAEQSLYLAKKNIEKALAEYDSGSNHLRVLVQVNKWDHLDVFWGADQFQGKNIFERLDMVFDYFRKTVGDKDFSLVGGVYALTPQEFDLMGIIDD